MEHIDKRGYLNTDYLLFHLSDRRSDEHTFHYHEFDKIVVMLSGNASYIIEGKEYFLRPMDILLVNHHDIHMPVIDTSEDYNRIVIWLNRDFCTTHSSKGVDLSLSFRLVHENAMSLLRVEEDERDEYLNALSDIEKAVNDTSYGSALIADCALVRYLTMLNRLAIRGTGYDTSELFRRDEKIGDIIDYINNNLQVVLDSETLAQKFYISKSYLMHKFKSETGYTLHNYVLQKRLLHSRELLSNGLNVNEAALASGFTEYTTFLRAFKKLFGCLPSDFS